MADYYSMVAPIGQATREGAHIGAFIFNELKKMNSTICQWRPLTRSGEGAMRQATLSKGLMDP